MWVEVTVANHRWVIEVMQLMQADVHFVFHSNRRNLNDYYRPNIVSIPQNMLTTAIHDHHVLLSSSRYRGPSGDERPHKRRRLEAKLLAPPETDEPESEAEAEAEAEAKRREPEPQARPEPQPERRRDPEERSSPEQSAEPVVASADEPTIADSQEVEESAGKNKQSVKPIELWYKRGTICLPYTLAVALDDVPTMATIYQQMARVEKAAAALHVELRFVALALIKDAPKPDKTQTRYERRVYSKCKNTLPILFCK
jgi:hypothetical protein